MKERFSEQYYKALVDWLASGKLFDTFVTYRPKKTKITGFNAPKFFEGVMDRLKSIKDLFWVVEGDRNPASNHAHILLNAGDINKQILANAMKRNQNEIKYFETIKDIEGSLIYVNKYLKGRHFRGSDYINRETYEAQADNKWFYDNMAHSRTMDIHPNGEYHRNAQFKSQFFYGWGTMNDRFQKEQTTANFSRKDGLHIDTKVVNEAREVVRKNIQRDL